MPKKVVFKSQIHEFVQWADRPCYVLDEMGNILFSNALADMARKKLSKLETEKIFSFSRHKSQGNQKIKVSEEYSAVLRDIAIDGQKIVHITLQSHSEKRDEIAIDERVESVINALQEGVYITDGEGFTQRINNAYTGLTGLTKDDVEGRHIAELVSQGIFDSSVTVNVMKEKEKFSKMQKINNNTICLVTGVPIFDANKNLISIINSAYDLTEMNSLQESVKNREISLKIKENEIERLRSYVSQSNSDFTRSPAMNKINSISQKLSDFNVPVLLLGATGTGKSAMAYKIHEKSERSSKAFIEVNCGAIPVNLFESELFGYAKGAFTGASNSGKAGLIESAHEGTLFFDEVGEMPIPLQVKLLTFLQTGKIRRLGETCERIVNARIISATNKDPEELIQIGELREDLFYRLSLVTLKLPSLMERKEDLFFLVKTILDKMNARHKKSMRISKDVFLLLERYDWPGNIRELEHVIEQMVVLSDESMIEIDNLPDKINPKGIRNPETKIETNLKLQEYMDNQERDFLLSAIKNTPDIKNLSSELGVHRTTLIRKLKRHGIK